MGMPCWRSYTAYATWMGSSSNQHWQGHQQKSQIEKNYSGESNDLWPTPLQPFLFCLVAFLVLLMLLSFATDMVYASLYLKFNQPCVGLWESSVPFILLSNIHHILRKHLQSPNKNEVFIFGSAEYVKEIFNLDGIALTSSIYVRKLSTRTSTLTQHRLPVSCNIVKSCL